MECFIAQRGSRTRRHLVAARPPLRRQYIFSAQPANNGLKTSQPSWTPQKVNMAPIYKIAVIQLHPKVSLSSPPLPHNQPLTNPSPAPPTRNQLPKSLLLHRARRLARRPPRRPARIPPDQLAALRPSLHQPMRPMGDLPAPIPSPSAHPQHLHRARHDRRIPPRRAKGRRQAAQRGLFHRQPRRHPGQLSEEKPMVTAPGYPLLPPR